MTATSTRTVASQALSAILVLGAAHVSSGCMFAVRSLENAPGHVELEPKSSKRLGSVTPWEAPSSGPRTDPKAFPVGIDVGEDPGIRGWLVRGAIFTGAGAQAGYPSFWHFGGCSY